MKDLRIIKNRRIEDIVVVDNTILSLRNQLENVIYIPAYKGNEDDTELISIMDFLVKIANTSDVRPYVTKFAGIKLIYKDFLNNQKS